MSASRSLPVIGTALSAIALGMLVTAQPRAAALLAVGGALAFIFLATPEHQLSRAAVLGVVMLAGTVDLIRRLQVGSTSAYAWVTGVVAVTTLVVLLRSDNQGRPANVPLLPLLLLPIWAFATLVIDGVNISGVQNTLVYVSLPLIVALTATAISSGSLSFSSVRTAFLYAYLLGAALYAASLVVGGIGGGSIAGARSFALFAMTGVAWASSLIRFDYRSEWVILLVSLLLILLSLSRAAFAISLAIALLALSDFRSGSRLLRTTVTTLCIVAIGYLAITHFGAFSERFSSGDVQSVLGGTANVNLSGRENLWSITFDSAMTSPIIGHGAGSAETTIARTLGRSDQPHSDYLRVFNDFGLVGLALLALLVLTLIRSIPLRRKYVLTREQAAASRAAIVSLLGLLAAMVTDNPSVYLFVIAPVAAMVGLAAGLHARDT